MVKKDSRRADWGKLSEAGNREQEKKGELGNACWRNGLKKRNDSRASDGLKFLLETSRQNWKQCIRWGWCSFTSLKLKSWKDKRKAKYRAWEAIRSTGKNRIAIKDSFIEVS